MSLRLDEARAALAQMSNPTIDDLKRLVASISGKVADSSEGSVYRNL